MKAVKGVYNGDTVRVLEFVDAKPNAKVVVTFLDEDVPTEDFLSTCGGWEDTRNPDEIIEEIYSLRSLSTRPDTAL